GISNNLLYTTTSPIQAYFDGELQTEQYKLYSFFVFGLSPNFDTLLVQDNLPNPYRDSVLGIRLINLSPNSNPLSLTIASDTKVNIFSGIVYKRLTDFVTIPLPGNVTTNAVTFQVRDAITNNVLTTYTLPLTPNSTYLNIGINKSRFMNLTLVVRGLQGTTSGSSAIGLFPVANY
ncbi:MAG: DUF4397 domain-containing protein, partial [Niastella sp.]|nr:DUF4397 domain-containing protein [Niastella sp.]